MFLMGQTFTLPFLQKETNSLPPQLARAAPADPSSASSASLSPPPLPATSSTASRKPQRSLLSRFLPRASAPQPQKSPDGSKHLIVLVNGLWGNPGNWSVVQEKLLEQLDSSHYLIHASEVNQLLSTYDGIDTCGQRLADEVRTLAAANPSLRRISVIGHSMGGLLARYAIGALFNPRSATICGLQPRHFITMATPHMGCDAEGLSQVPFIGWSAELPLLGGTLAQLLQMVSAPLAAILLGRTGAQFFLTDQQQQQQQQQQQEPLLVQMTSDLPAEGLFFRSALASFATRTCYANCDGDHLVGWANSCLRHTRELPQLPAEHATARGVVLEQGLAAAFHAPAWQRISSSRASARGQQLGAQLAASAPAAGGSGSGALAAAAGAAGGSRQVQAAEEALQRHQAVDSRGWHSISSGRAAGASSRSASPAAAAEQQQAAAAAAAVMQEEASQGVQVPAARDARSALAAADEAAQAEVDLACGLSRSSSISSGSFNSCTSGTSGTSSHSEIHLQPTAPEQQASGPGCAPQPPSSRARQVSVMLERLQQLPWRRVDVCFRGATWGFAHNNIQVTRPLLNFQGLAVPRHLAQQLADMEVLLELAEQELQQAGDHGVQQAPGQAE